MTLSSGILFILLVTLIASSELTASVLVRATELTCSEGYRQHESSATCILIQDHDEEMDVEDPDLDTLEELDELVQEEEEDEYDDEDEDDDSDDDDEEFVITETVEQEVSGSDEEIAGTQEVLNTMMKYIEEELPKQKYDKVRALCINKDKLCSFWASQGECETSSSYMKVDCALACQSCEYLDIQNRCKLDPNAVDIWKPGDLHNMFHRIAHGPDSSTRKVQVLSHPSAENMTGKEGFGPLPWVIIIDEFITEAECKRLIDIGSELGYKRSKDVGDELPDGTYDSVVSRDRTSTNAWCDELCDEDEVVQGVIKKIQNLTGIPDSHSEHLQLLKYEEGQFYATHHDFIEYQVDRPCGPRIATAFLYLNDVEAGGGTNFPELNVTVMPKMGRLLLWPSVLDHDPTNSDQWTMHQALPVEKGVKYGANGWLHLRDYKSAHDNNCD